jgi:uncharacterized protein YcfL
MSIVNRYIPALLLASITAAALLSVGCNSVNPPIAGRQDPYGRNQINYEDTDLRDTTTVGAPIVTRDQYGVLIVTVDIRNTTNHSFQVEYEVTWLDKNNQQISKESWQPENLEANVPNQIIVKGPPEANDFQIDFRHPE